MAQSEFWNKLKTRIKDVSIAAADFTEEQAVIGKLKFEILTLKRKSVQIIKQLGSHIYQMSELTDKPSVFDDFEVKEFIRDITDINEQIEVKRSEIEVVSDNFRSRKKTKSSESDQPSDDDVTPFSTIKTSHRDGSPSRPKKRKTVKSTDSKSDDSAVKKKTRTRRKSTRRPSGNNTDGK